MKNLKQDLLLDLFNLRHGINGIFSPSTHSFLETTPDATEKLKVNTYIAKSINSKLNGYFEGLSEEDRYKGTLVENTFDTIRQRTGNYKIVFTNKNYSNTEYKFEKVDCNFLFSFVYNDQINKNNNSKKFRERIFSEFSNFTAENRLKNRLSRKTRMLPLKGLYKNTREVLAESLRTEEIDRILDTISQDELKDFYNIQNKVWKNYYYYNLITYDKSIFEDLNYYLTPSMETLGFKEEPAERMKLIWDTYYKQTLENSNIETLWNFINNTDYEDYKQKLIQSYIDTHVEYLKTRNAEDKKTAKILLKEKTLSDYTNDDGNEVIDRLKEFVEKINESSKWKELFNGKYIKYTLSYKVENEENIKLKTKNSTYRIHYIDFTDNRSFLIRFKFNQNISGDIRFDKVRLFAVIPMVVPRKHMVVPSTASFKILAEKKKVISKIYLGDKIMDKTVLENIFTIIKWFLEDVTKNKRQLHHLTHNENNPKANYISLFVNGFNNYLKFNIIEKTRLFNI